MTKREKQLLDALKGLMGYVGGWDADATHPCGVAARAIQECEAAAPRFADVSWTAADVQTLAARMTDAQAAEWLENNQSNIRDRLVETGWTVIEALLGDEAREGEECLIPAEARRIVERPLHYQTLDVTLATGYTSMGYPMTPPRTFTDTWRVSMYLSHMGGELNLDVPLGELAGAPEKLQGLLDQVFNDDCFLASVDDAFGVMFVQEYETADSFAGSQWPARAEVERRLQAFIAKEQVRWPALRFCIPPEAHVHPGKTAIWVFIPDGVLDEEGRADFVQAIYSQAYGPAKAA